MADNTAVRERQNADYQQEKAEMEQTINALERAIGVSQNFFASSWSRPSTLWSGRLE
jgi:hypothetical protein